MSTCNVNYPLNTYCVLSPHFLTKNIFYPKLTLLVDIRMNCSGNTRVSSFAGKAFPVNEPSTKGVNEVLKIKRGYFPHFDLMKIGVG